MDKLTELTLMLQTSDMFLPSMTSRYMVVGVTSGRQANSASDRLVMVVPCRRLGDRHRGSIEWGTVKFSSQRFNSYSRQSQFQALRCSVKSLCEQEIPNIKKKKSIETEYTWTVDYPVSDTKYLSKTNRHSHFRYHYPLKERAIIWCLATCAKTLLSREILVQSDQQF